MNWYNLPTYYDVSFSHEMKEELVFLRHIFKIHCIGDRPRLLEPACGTGRLLIPLTRAGFDCTGFDLNDNALRYLQEKLIRNNSNAHVVNADMSDFRISGKKYDGAYCTVDTFRHLLDKNQTEQHLINISKSLKKNGIYVLGLHLIPKQGVTDKITRWTAKRGGLTVKTTMKMLKLDEDERTETLKVILEPKRSTGKEKFVSIYKLRTYNLKQFRKLLSKTKVFEILEVYDYDYDISRPIKLNEYSDYGVFVLKKI